MATTYTRYLTEVETLTIPQVEHQLAPFEIQAVLYMENRATGQFPLTPGLIRHCTYLPPDFVISLTFTRPVTGYLFIHEHPDVRLRFVQARYRA